MLLGLLFPGAALNLVAPQAPSAQSRQSHVEYKVTGDREVRPSSIRDDGARTYIRWEVSQAIPAVFAIDRKGHEEIVNGYMRGDEFVLDRLYTTLIFRIDDALAMARRIGTRSK